MTTPDQTELVDTHCHIHSQWYKLDPDAVLKHATGEGVTKIICVGTDVEDSRRAVAFAADRANCWASVGVHPHDSRKELDRVTELDEILEKAPSGKVVAIGEIGLDFYYNHSPKKEQLATLHYQIKLAQRHDLPIIFHVRDAFAEFWNVFDSYTGLRGVIHSFSATRHELDEILVRDLYVGLNGIMTFTKRVEQLDAAQKVPDSKLLVETDAPFLTPIPHRGKLNRPGFLRDTISFLAKTRGQTRAELAAHSTNNANKLFNI